MIDVFFRFGQKERRLAIEENSSVTKFYCNMNSKHIPHVIHQFWMSNIYPYYYLNSAELEVMKRWLPFRTVLVFNP
jgi:hypothetical protein